MSSANAVPMFKSEFERSFNDSTLWMRTWGHIFRFAPVVLVSLWAIAKKVIQDSLTTFLIGVFQWAIYFCLVHRQPNVMVACAQAHVAQATITLGCLCLVFGSNHSKSSQAGSTGRGGGGGCPFFMYCICN